MSMYDWYEQNGYADEIEEPVDVRFICEPQKLYLRPGNIYKFVVDPNCEDCVRLGSVYE